MTRFLSETGKVLSNLSTETEAPNTPAVLRMSDHVACLQSMVSRAAVTLFDHIKASSAFDQRIFDADSLCHTLAVSTTLGKNLSQALTAYSIARIVALEKKFPAYGSATSLAEMDRFARWVWFFERRNIEQQRKRAPVPAQ